MHNNATSVVVTSREVYPHLKRAGGGLIVNIGSFFDKMGVTRSVAYCASKAAVGAITRCLAVEWAGDNIRVIDVAPGYIATDLNAEFREKESVSAGSTAHSVKRPGKPEEVAKLVGTLFKSDIVLTGETIYIDGGQGMSLMARMARGARFPPPVGRDRVGGFENAVVPPTPAPPRQGGGHA